MKLKIPVLIGMMFLCGLTTAQVRYSGALQTSVYTFERPDAVQQGNFYQALNLKLFPATHPNLSLKTYLRVAKQGNAGWDERLYHLTANWRDRQDRVSIAVGRQFLYQGVLNGTYDGFQFSVSPQKQLQAGVFFGVEVPYQRTMRIVSSDSSAVGGFLKWRYSEQLSVDASYFKRVRNDNAIWHLAGLALHGKLYHSAYYQIQIDHNLEIDKLQGVKSRLSYLYQQWQFTGEYSFQRPRIWEDSFFKIFNNLAEFQQLRAAVTYRLSRYQIGMQYVFTDYEFDQANQVILNFAGEYGTLGILFQDGYGGENAGLFGEVRYPLLDNLNLRFYGSYQNYQRYLVEISEDAVAFSGGADYEPWTMLTLRAEVQQSRNSYYENDVRGLFRMIYRFRQ